MDGGGFLGRRLGAARRDQLRHIVVEKPGVMDKGRNLRSLTHVHTSALLLTAVSTAAVATSKFYALSQIPEIATLGDHWARIVRGSVATSLRELAIACLPGLILQGCLMLRPSAPLRRFAIGVAILATIAIGLLNLASAELLRVFGTPVTVGLILYSDILFSDNGRIAVFSWVSHGVVVALIAAIVLALAGCLIFRLVERSRLALVGAIGGGALIAAVLSDKRIDVREVYRVSATASFVRSFDLLRPNSALARPTTVAAPLTSRWEAGLRRESAAGHMVRNVVMIVLESTGARYLDSYGAHYGATPVLSALAPRAIHVMNAYAQAASSTRSMAVLLGSRYPAVGLNDLPPGGPALPEILHKAGWATGFFHSSDIRYGGADRILAHSGFERISDYRSRRCADRLLNDVTELNSQGTTEACTFRQMREWITQVRTRPFFAQLWTFQTHYPYFALDEKRAPLGDELRDDSVTRANKQRYLTALRETDHQIGELIRFLQNRGLLASTLIVIVGDHGEAFQQHGTSGHGSDLYEESVRVPLLFWHPALRPQAFERVTGHIDVAPTIVDLLGLKPPPTWQGTSLFRPRRAEPIYFSSPWTDLLVGFRRGNEKVIVNILARKAQRFDLSRDPEERHDLAASDTAWQARTIAQVSAWARAINGSPR